MWWLSLKIRFFLDDTPVADSKSVREQEYWLIPTLQVGLQKAIEEKKKEMQSGLKNRLRNTFARKNQESEEESEEERIKRYAWARVTMQADKELDFLTIKKVMYTITEAGASLINFAVVPKKSKKDN